MSYAICDRCGTETEHEGTTHDCIVVLRMRLDEIEHVLALHYHDSMGSVSMGPSASVRFKKGEMSDRRRERRIQRREKRILKLCAKYSMLPTPFDPGVLREASERLLSQTSSGTVIKKIETWEK